MLVARVLLLALALAPAFAGAVDAAPPPPTARVVDAPVLVPADGAPFAAVIAVTGAPHAVVDVRVTVLSGTVPLARAWTGAAWAAPSRYALTVTLDAHGAWTAPVTLALAEGAPDGAAVRVAARARATDGGAAGAWAWRDATLATPAYAAAVPALARGEVAWLVRADGTPVASVARTVGVPVIAGPADADLTLVTPAGRAAAPAVPAARVTRLAADTDRVTLEAANGSLAGVCARVGRDVACVADDAREGVLNVTVPDAGGGVTLTLGPVVLDASTFPRARTGHDLVRDGDAWREVRRGRSAFAPASFRVDAVTPLVLPQDGYAALHALVTHATRTLDVSGYTFESPAIARLLADAAARGVRVRVLVDGAPAGGVDADERRAVAALAAAGAVVRADGPHHRAHHAKVMLADDARVLVASENWNPASWPVDARTDARRGWGARVDDTAVAAHLARVFAFDWNASRAFPAPSTPASLPPAPAPERDAPPTVRATRVDAVVAPDHALADVLALVANASRSLDVQQLAIQRAWDGAPSPLVDALLAAAERGVRVRVLVDGALGNAENARVVGDLNALAHARNVTLEARVGAPERLLHNKGVLVDAERALVGSLNWGRAAFEDNREIALIVHGRDAVAPWARAFHADWDAAAPPAGLADSAARATPGAPPAAALALAAAGARALTPSRGSAPRGGRSSHRTGGPRTRPPRPCPRPSASRSGC